jgi:hypothetical protein
MEGRIKRMSCSCREFDVTENLQEDVARIPNILVISVFHFTFFMEVFSS